MKKEKKEIRKGKITQGKAFYKSVYENREVKIDKIDVERKDVKKKKFDFREKRTVAILGALVGLAVSTISFFINWNILTSAIVLAGIFALFIAYSFVRVYLQKAAEVKKMEEVFPDFIGLMASNLRAGMTIDRALLLSSRKEFAPLDKEILTLGKDIVTGKEITQALEDAAKRIKSDKIAKTIKLIISGIRAGGNLAILLEETAKNMRERNFVEKRAASNVLMYVIFISFAVTIGAPLLFGLSSVLVEILTQLISNLPGEQVVTNVPFALTSISISTTFITYFCLIFLVTTAILSSLLLGLVSKGHEREGLKYMVPMIVVAVALFFLSRIVLLRYFSDLAF